MNAAQQVQFRRPPVVHHPARIVVDPNSVDRDDPTLTVASLAEADRVPSVGDFVTARQPDDDGSDFVGGARVVSVNPAAGLVYLRVDWPSFREIPSVEDVTQVAAQGLRYHYTLRERRSTTRPPRSGETNTAGLRLAQPAVRKVRTGA